MSIAIYTQTFHISGPPADQTDLPMPVTGAAEVPEITTPWAGAIVALSFHLSPGRTAGAATVSPTINGVPQGPGHGPQASADAANPTGTAELAPHEACPYKAGDRIGVAVTTTADWLPTGGDNVGGVATLWMTVGNYEPG